MGLSEKQTELYTDIIQILSPPKADPTSSAKLQKEVDGDPTEIGTAVRDLIAFGELELVGTSQYARVRLRQRPSYEQSTLSRNFVWRAYITAQDGDGRTRAERLFSDKDEAENHILQLISKDSLKQVPNIPDVWYAPTKGKDSYLDEYAVVRREPIFKNAP